MIFINRTANYTNNIGSVEIPTDINDTASAILAKYTKTLSDVQKQAFSDLIEGMIDAGIYDKVEFMYLPCLAGSVSEAFYDVINDTSQDMSAYGQFALDGNGLLSTYDSSVTYNPKLLSITRSTYGGTISSLFHATSSVSAYVYHLKIAGTGVGPVLRGAHTARNYITSTMNGGKLTTDTFESNMVAANSLVFSFIPDGSSWLPDSSNSKAILNGEEGTMTTTITSAISVVKANTLTLASYTSYGSSFTCANGSLDAFIISECLDGVACVDDSSVTMSAKMAALLDTFKAVFFA